jgi:hypothetical protein
VRTHPLPKYPSTPFPMMRTKFISYELLSVVVPAADLLQNHCHVRRGFAVARQHEPQVRECANHDRPIERVKILVQKAVYQFWKNPQYLTDRNGIKWVSDRLNLSKESSDVRKRVLSILEFYFQSPFLADKNVNTCESGGICDPLVFEMNRGDRTVLLQAQIDCSYWEEDGTLHLVIFKTGHQPLDPISDRRQLYVCLLAASYWYPDRRAIASIYNLETGEKSPVLSATPAILDAYRIELWDASDRLQQEEELYRQVPDRFFDIYPRPFDLSICSDCNYKPICSVSSD